MSTDEMKDTSSWSEDSVQEKTMNDLPHSWQNVSNEDKVNDLLLVASRQITRLRGGDFSLSKSQETASLMLEAQLALVDLVTMCEAQARQAKLETQYVEAELSEQLVKDALAKKQKRGAIKAGIERS